MWDTSAAERYEGWFQTRAGSFALAAEKRLLNQMISGWPRRGQSLLEIGCGTGIFLQGFWEAGFDVTGLDRSPEMLSAARQRLGERADLQVGAACTLPYEDREFDFVALLTVLEFLPDPLEALREARRVARKGLLVAFLNRCSLYYLRAGLPLPGLRDSTLRKAHWFTPLEIRRMLLQAAPGKRLALRTVLPGPVWSWRRTPPLSWCNSLPLPFPFWCGAFGAARVDLFESVPLTPLLLFSKEPKPKQTPAQAAF